MGTDFHIVGADRARGLAAIHDPAPSFAMRFRLARKELCMSQRELAGALGIVVQSVSDIERGVNGISLRIVSELVTRYRVSAYWLLEGTGPVMRDEPRIRGNG